jgi:hypothetical protein
MESICRSSRLLLLRTGLLLLLLLLWQLLWPCPNLLRSCRQLWLLLLLLLL